MARSATKVEKRHLSTVAQLGCVVCRNQGRALAPQPAEYTAIHHIRNGQGLSQRATHFEVLPLCGAHHQTGGYGVAIHSGQAEWEKKYGGEVQLLAQVYMMLENGGDYNLLSNNGGCGCEYCLGAWRKLLGVDDD